MPAEFHITDYGSPQIIAEKMFDSGKRALDTHEVQDIIAIDMMRITNIEFTSEGRRLGGSWAPLAASTVLKKGHSQILQDTEKLIDSVTKPGAEYQILNIGLEGMEFGTDRPYAYVHQYGSRKRKIPARPFLRFGPNDERRWRDLLAGHILRPFA